MKNCHVSADFGPNQKYSKSLNSIQDRLNAQKTISRYCPFKVPCKNVERAYGGGIRESSVVNGQHPAL